MAIDHSPREIRRFVTDALRLSGSAWSEVEGELVLASCQVTRPAGIFCGPQVLREDLQMVFTAEAAGRLPTAELVCPGSYRLTWFIGGIRARGFLTRQFYADEAGAHRLEREILAALPPRAPRFSLQSQRRSYLPFLLAILKISASAEVRREELLPLALNLQDGTFRPGLPERLRGARFVPDLAYQRVERRRITWRETWRLLQEAAARRVEEYGRDWYEPALARLRQEGEQLREFYEEMLAEAEEGETLVAEYRRRLAELENKYCPAIRISLANAALLYLPRLTYAVVSAEGRPLPPLHYEPAAGAVFWEALS